MKLSKMFKKPEMRIYNIDNFWKIIVLTSIRNDWFHTGHRTVLAPRIVCKDGFSVSVQAGSCMHSEPREDGLFEYDSYELGWPTERVKLLDDYAEYVYDDPDTDWTHMVYTYVPKAVVNKLIRRHGGIVDVKWQV